MTARYLMELDTLLSKAAEVGLETRRLSCRHFFSGAALYVDGQIFASLTPAGFALKVPEAQRVELLKTKRARPLRYFPNAPIKKQYVVLAEGLIRRRKDLRRWLEVAIEYVSPSESK